MTVPISREYDERQDLLETTEEELAKSARLVVRRAKTPWLAPEVTDKVGRHKNQYKAAKQP